MMPNQALDQIEQRTDFSALDEVIKAVPVGVRAAVECVDRLLEKENVQVHRDPPPLDREDGAVRSPNFAPDFESDVIVEETAQLCGHFAQLELRRNRLKTGALREWHVRLRIARHATMISQSRVGSISSRHASAYTASQPFGWQTRECALCIRSGSRGRRTLHGTKRRRQCSAFYHAFYSGSSLPQDAEHRGRTRLPSGISAVSP